MRDSGVLLPVFSLPGPYSVGSFGASARRFLDRLAEGGFTLWQVLPFCLPDDCHSPYKSYSAFSGNPYFIDLDLLAARGLITREELASAKETSPYLCEYDRLKEERLPLLRRAFSRLDSAEERALERFAAENPEIDGFCRFMALKEANKGAPWTEFTTEVYRAQDLAFWRFLQYEFFRQWDDLHAYAAKVGIKIIGDIPIYVAHDSSDVYFHREDFLLDGNGLPREVAGVPPDYFCPDGQMWGNPLYDWSQMKKNGYAFWRARLSFFLSRFDGVRLDHFRGFESFYAIPREAENAKAGRWRKGPGESFLRAVRDLTQGKLVIAEDLGDITPAVHRLVKKSGFPPMRVLQFGFLGDADSIHRPHRYPKECVCYSGTHDNNTLLGYLFEMPQEQRRELLAYVGHEGDFTRGGCDAVLRTLMASCADHLILPMQDILGYGADTRINRPGLAKGNWQYRLTEEQLEGADFEKLRRMNALFGRLGKENGE